MTDLHDLKTLRRLSKLNTISRRDYFAAAALMGIMANSAHYRNPKKTHKAAELAKLAADRLIEALNEKGK